MISALGLYLDENDPGPGLYFFAQDLGLLAKNATPSQWFELWAKQVSALHAHCA